MVLIEEIKSWAASAPLPPADGFDEHPLWTLSVAAGITTTGEGSLPRKEDQAWLDKAESNGLHQLCAIVITLSVLKRLERRIKIRGTYVCVGENMNVTVSDFGSDAFWSVDHKKVMCW